MSCYQCHKSLYFAPVRQPIDEIFESELSKLVLPKTRNQAYRPIFASMLVLAAISVLALFVTTVEYAKAYFIGGVCWFLPQLYAAYKIFHKIETNPKHLLIIFYRTEIVKLLFLAGLFVITMKYLSLGLGCLLAGYLSAQLYYWIVVALNR